MENQNTQQYSSASQQAAQTSGYIQQIYPQPCPTCGRCPSCGRGGYWGFPYYQQPYVTWGGYQSGLGGTLGGVPSGFNFSVK